jgi:hypothetical protein
MAWSRRFYARPEYDNITPAWEATMDEQQPQQQTIRIALDDNVAQGEYINFANIIHSPSEFVIDLGRVVPGRPDVKIYSRVITTPLHAKQLLEALAHNIGLYESKFGEIRVDAATQFSVNEPSN